MHRAKLNKTKTKRTEGQTFAGRQQLLTTKWTNRLLYMLYFVGDVTGVTQLGDIVYVVFAKSPIIKTFTADTLSPLGAGIHVKGMRDPRDIVACRDDRQLYVADWSYCIWRVSVTDDGSTCAKWLIESFHFTSLSLTSRRLLVTSQPRSLRQYSTTDGQLLHQVCHR